MCPPLPLSSSFHSGKCKVEEGKGGRRRRRRGNFPWEFWEKRKKMKEGEGASLQLNPPSKSRWKKKEEEKEEEDIGVWGERRKQAPRICHISRCRGFDREKERERERERLLVQIHRPISSSHTLYILYTTYARPFQPKKTTLLHGLSSLRSKVLF